MNYMGATDSNMHKSCVWARDSVRPCMYQYSTIDSCPSGYYCLKKVSIIELTHLTHIFFCLNWLTWHMDSFDSPMYINMERMLDWLHLSFRCQRGNIYSYTGTRRCYSLWGQETNMESNQYVIASLPHFDSLILLTHLPQLYYCLNCPIYTIASIVPFILLPQLIDLFYWLICP